VSKRLRALSLAGEEAYLDYLQNDTSGAELMCFLDAISTNYTSFMRERDHFDMLAQWVGQDLILTRSRLRLWCAAASSGEEPYSIAITMLDALDGRDLDFRILATDISTKVLTAAVAGRYPEKAVEPLSRAQRARYLQKIGSEVTGAEYEVRPGVKERIVFRRLNLSRLPFPMKGPLDVVFCRNVMIYFDRPTRQALVTEIDRLLAPGGILFIGHSETLAGIRTVLKAVRPSVYRKPEAATVRREEAA
jgi:chemotaxis protein methyltransferase CheR